MSSQYDFDTIIDRHHTGAMKTDVLCERYGREDLIPLCFYRDRNGTKAFAGQL